MNASGLPEPELEVDAVAEERKRLGQSSGRAVEQRKSAGSGKTGGGCKFAGGSSASVDRGAVTPTTTV